MPRMIGDEKKLKILYARIVLVFMGLAPLLLVPAARAATSLEMSGNLVLIGDPTLRGSLEARAIGDPNSLVGTGKFETSTMTILFSFTGNIIGDPNDRAVVTISGAVTQSNDPALLRIPVTVNGLVEPDTTQISLTLGAIGDPNQKTFVGVGLISIETNGR